MRRGVSKNTTAIPTTPLLRVAPFGTRRRWRNQASPQASAPQPQHQLQHQQERTKKGAVYIDDIDSGPTRIFFESLDDKERPFISVYDRSDGECCVGGGCRRGLRRSHSGRLPRIGRKFQ